MGVVRLERQDEDLGLVFRLEHLINGAVRYARTRYVHVVRIAGWFGGRWCRFAGTVNGRDVHDARLAVPPFAPNRVLSEATYARRGDVVRRIEARPLHETAQRSSSVTYLDERTASSTYVWYSASTAGADRASIMVYDVERDGVRRAWYAELQRREGTWSYVSTLGTSVTELAELETAYGNRLEPLFESAHDVQRAMLRDLWDRALELSFGNDIAQAMVLIEQYRAIKPEDPYGGLLYARNLVARRRFQDAEELMRTIEHQSSRDGWRVVWLREWGELCDARGDDVATEAAYRELTYYAREETSSWIYLGSWLARRGRLDEAEAAHRIATELRGDVDEAYLNLGLVLRAQGRLEASAEAFERALRLCPGYPEAVGALADVRAALALQPAGTSEER